MHPKIVESFWSDAEFEAFEGAQLAAIRLTFLWAVTGPGTNVLGIFPITPRRFTLDTGLNAEWLLKTIEALPKAFTYDPSSCKALLRNYVRYQYGVGASLAKNNMTRTLRREIPTQPETLRAELIELYPELKPSPSPSEGHSKPYPNQSNQGSAHHSFPQTDLAEPGAEPKPLARATQAPSKGEGEGEGNSKGVQGGAGARPPQDTHDNEVLIPSLDEVIAYGDRIGVDRETCEAFHAFHESRGWMSGNTALRKPLSLLKGYAEGRRTIKKPAGSARLDKTGRNNADDLRAALQVETDPVKKAALQEQLRRATP